MTLHDVAVSTFPVGIECEHCLRHALLTADKAKATFGDLRPLDTIPLRCASCGSRSFNAVKFETRARMVSFMRNL